MTRLGLLVLFWLLLAPASAAAELCGSRICVKARAVSYLPGRAAIEPGSHVDLAAFSVRFVKRHHLPWRSSDASLSRLGVLLQAAFTSALQQRGVRVSRSCGATFRLREPNYVERTASLPGRRHVTTEWVWECRRGAGGAPSPEGGLPLAVIANLGSCLGARVCSGLAWATFGPSWNPERPYDDNEPQRGVDPPAPVCEAAGQLTPERTSELLGEQWAALLMAGW